MLNGPGFNDHLTPKVLKVLLGITLSHSFPKGYDTSWATIEVIVMVGDRIEKSIFNAEPTVVIIIPKHQLRMVFAGTS